MKDGGGYVGTAAVTFARLDVDGVLELLRR
jgi:hypothetical protein